MNSLMMVRRAVKSVFAPSNSLKPQSLPFNPEQERARVEAGCLWKSLETREAEGGVGQSNLDEFPDDGSPRSEERVRAFEFAKAAVLALQPGKAEAHHQ